MTCGLIKEEGMSCKHGFGAYHKLEHESDLSLLMAEF
jgi:hypothetical protein